MRVCGYSFLLALVNGMLYAVEWLECAIWSCAVALTCTGNSLPFKNTPVLPFDAAAGRGAACTTVTQKALSHLSLALLGHVVLMPDSAGTRMINMAEAHSPASDASHCYSSCYWQQAKCLWLGMLALITSTCSDFWSG